MLSSLSFFCLTLTGCGFHPTLATQPYGDFPTKGAASPIKLIVKGIEGYPNHAFYQGMQKRLAPLHFQVPVTIEVTLSQTYMDVSFGADATTTRSQNIMIADVVFMKNGKMVRKSRVDSVTSFTVDENDEFSTLNSRLGADEKVIQALIEEVMREIMFVG